MKALIIDDEKKARRLLNVILSENCPEVTQIEEAPDLPSGVRLIHSFEPDIVFLDIEMPGYSGMQLLEFLNPAQVTFELVFTTAYNQYAVKAFELNAIDYLLKPLHTEQIEQTIKKVVTRRGKNQVSKQLFELQSTLQANHISKIAFPLTDSILFVALEDIIFLCADRMYTKAYTVSDGVIMVSKPLKFFSKYLDDLPSFFKPHRSFIINLNRIKKYVHTEGGYIIMENGETVTIVKERKKKLFNLIQGI